MRKWIVEEIGEKRSPKVGEWFINDVGDFMFMSQYFPCSPREIVKVTIITDNDKVPSFDEWNW